MKSLSVLLKESVRSVSGKEIKQKYTKYDSTDAIHDNIKDTDRFIRSKRKLTDLQKLNPSGSDINRIDVLNRRIQRTNRASDVEELEKIMSLLKKYKTNVDVYPIVLNENGMILDGFHRLQALTILHGTKSNVRIDVYEKVGK